MVECAATPVKPAAAGPVHGCGSTVRWNIAGTMPTSVADTVAVPGVAPDTGFGPVAVPSLAVARSTAFTGPGKVAAPLIANFTDAPATGLPSVSSTVTTTCLAKFRFVPTRCPSPPAIVTVDALPAVTVSVVEPVAAPSVAVTSYWPAW